MENNNNPVKQTKEQYREAVRNMGKKEFTLLKMQEYGFWPKDKPTPKERQQNESQEDYKIRIELLKEYDVLAKQIADLYQEKSIINSELQKLRNEYSNTWAYEKVRRDIAQRIMKESIERRAARKAEREQAKKEKSDRWQKLKSENIVFIGKGYSGALSDKAINVYNLKALNLPIIETDRELADLLSISYKQLRYLAYHRDVVDNDHYHHYTIKKRNGGERNIAAPKSILKHAQRSILTQILEKINVSEYAHGFLQGKSILTGACTHKSPELLINMDIKDFFPTITFARVRGMFKSFGYSGYIASLLAMLCTYCERSAIVINGSIKYVKTTDRILSQGSPASPMITNIICSKLDDNILELSKQYNFKYSRYADDMSFSFDNNADKDNIKQAIRHIMAAVKNAGFKVNNEKTRFLRQNTRQCVTGIVVNNEKPGVPKIWVKRMRAALYNAQKAKKEGVLSKAKINELLGMASWLSGIDKERYKSLIVQAYDLAKS